MDTIKEKFDLAKSGYDAGNCPSIDIKDTVIASISTLNTSITNRYLYSIGAKSYNAFEANAKISSLYLPFLHTSNVAGFYCSIE